MTEQLPEWRNPVYTPLGKIDLEINHPAYGWIPFTADPDDAEPLGPALYDAAVELGEVADCPPPSPEALQATIVAAVQDRLDAFARTRGYDSILSAATYAGDSIPQFAAEGQRAAELRGQTWAALYAMLAEVHAGTRPVPAGYAEIEGELPVLEWPN
jgi:hypothetical protein